MKAVLFLPIFVFSIFQICFAESVYVLDVDNNQFAINYESDANVIAMDLDQEIKSLLVGIDNPYDSYFEIEFPQTLIAADNDEFAVLINGYEINYLIEKNSNFTTLRFFTPSGTEEIEIIGTYVVPEFPLGSLFIFGTILTSCIFIQKYKNRIML